MRHPAEKLGTGCGSASSMQYREERLYIVTTDDLITRIDAGDGAIRSAVSGAVPEANPAATSSPDSNSNTKHPYVKHACRPLRRGRRRRDGTQVGRCKLLQCRLVLVPAGGVDPAAGLHQDRLLSFGGARLDHRGRREAVPAGAMRADHEPVTGGEVVDVPGEPFPPIGQQQQVVAHSLHVGEHV